MKPILLEIVTQVLTSYDTRTAMTNEIETTLTRFAQDLVAQLPARIDVLEQLLAKVALGERGATEMLHHAAHSLVGAAGVHRLLDVAEAARKLEAIAAAMAPDRKADEPRLYALHKALARLAAVSERPGARLRSGAGHAYRPANSGSGRRPRSGRLAALGAGGGGLPRGDLQSACRLP